ncbi:amidohydrolase [Planobispora siamensis]|uniref:Amidohydrolase n=1 Tax=Planobispora siamensis TaxID=936338 RepID=A0A8J3SQV9_9ACTN|nr:amidohydrolase family protein [Planobispora siamensis]GIH97161.1 amidohydrolase [Planobispora siamensis]
MASLLLRNARMGPGGPVRHVLIDGGRIAGVSPEPPDCDESVDVEGGTVLPGLWDAHVHSRQWAQARRRIDLSSARSARQAAELVASRADPSGITTGYGFRDALWPDTPDKELLEAVAPGRAMVLISNDLHTAWFSPAALAVVGRGGHPTGVLREQDCYSAMAELPPPPREELDRWVAEAATAAAARGVVGLLDFEFADNVTEWARLAGERRIDVRVRCSIPKDRLEEAIGRGLRTGDPVGGSGGPLEVGPVKIFADGSLNTRTAYCEDPYPGIGTRGLLEIPPEELRSTMALAWRHGIVPAVHAIGDLAVGIALDAFERVGCPGRIEHAQLVRPEDFPRFARPGLVAGVQPAHAPDDREVADRHWHGRTGRAFAYAGLLAAGATLELGSDAPVAPLDPWDGIAAAVERTDDDRPPWHPEQAIPLTEALAAAAGGRRGVRPGDPADLVITEDDPARLEGEALRRVPIFGTLLAGRWTHRRP